MAMDGISLFYMAAFTILIASLKELWLFLMILFTNTGSSFEETYDDKFEKVKIENRKEN